MEEIMDLEELGWSSFFNEQLIDNEYKNYFPARVVSQHNDLYNIISPIGEYTAKVTGKFRFLVKQTMDYPVVGDFVLAENIEGSDNALIHRVMKRKNCFSRKMPISGGRRLKNGMIDGGTTEEQVVAANIDTAFIMCGLDNNFNISRIERYLTLVRHKKLQGVILLNKIDLCENLEKYLSQVIEIAGEIPVLQVSAVMKTGLEQLNAYMMKGKVIVFLGSSGVGKSTLLNSLADEKVQITDRTSDYSGKGRHTTTHRQMFFLPSGCMIIDTPGMREVQLWADVDDLDFVYKDIVDIIAQCRFSNCTHQNEPNCAVRAALQSGAITQERYERYLMQQKELTRLGQKKKEYNKKFKKKGNVK